MKNERKTENIVRSHFIKHENDCIIEEQKSDNPKIQKLLKTASKSGMGTGMPEFIISNIGQSKEKNETKFIIVIECKSDIRKHQSKDLDRYSEFAVDGVLLYAAFLSKEYDVLAIAVSGENNAELKVSHFLHLKGENKATTIFKNKLLPIGDYIDGYKTSPEKRRQDYDALLAFSKALNETLHARKVPESQRSLLISAILIALQNKAFTNSYKLHETPQHLAKDLVNTVIDELQNANLPSKKIDNLNTAYGFIKTHTSLSSEQEVLENLIESIDVNVNQFIKTHKYFDVLGQFYIEFLRYANSDSGLGIVLTPPHITELFSDLADVNKNSVIYDNCTGTGGFLIAAMNRMIKDAQGDVGAIKSIKERQLIGVEWQDHIFALACSNMFIHQDGKTNISHGSCFDQDIILSVKKLKPNIGFLNPPYQSKKKRDVEEFEFVLNNLQALEPNGTCIAIVPMQCILATSGSKYELKKRLLEKHTLEAVFSMPDELFINSDVGVVTAIIIVTAHKPHSKHKETFFGYWKNDGFVKRKNRGRVDANGEWEKTKQAWLNSYINRKSSPGASVNIKVTADDEWCAEAYMETDLSSLQLKDFKSIVLNYISFSIKTEHFSELNDFVQSDNRHPQKPITVSSWVDFKYSDLFDIKKGKRIVNSDMKSGNTPCIRPIDSDNGVFDYINLEPNHSGNTITVNYNGSVAEAFYQSIPYFALDDVNILYPKFNLNKYIGLFLTTIIRREMYRFNYGRKWHLERMKESIIKLPANKKGEPDWDFMENYIKNLPYSVSN